MAVPTNIYFSCLPPTSPVKRGLEKTLLPENDTKPPRITNNHGKNHWQETLATHFKVNPAKDSASFAQQLLLAQEHERQHLATELHDNLGHSLILIKNQVLKLKNNLPESAEVIVQLNTLAEMVSSTLQKVRTISYELRPYELNLFGLTHTLRSLAEEVAATALWNLTLELSLMDQLFPKEQEICLYRLFQDCLAVIQERAAATAVRVLAYCRQQAVTWEIHITGVAYFFTYLADNCLTDYTLLRLQEQLKILAGSIAFTAIAPRITSMQINIPLSSSYLTHEKA